MAKKDDPYITFLKYARKQMVEGKSCASMRGAGLPDLGDGGYIEV